MKKYRENIKSVIALTVICLVVTTLLALTNEFTAPIIESTRAEKIQASLKAVLPDESSFTEITDLPESIPDTIVSVYSGDTLGGYAVVLATRSSYSSGDMGITIGIDADGNIVNVVITSYLESKDFGKDTYPAEFVGKDMQSYSDVDTVAGVTYSSDALKYAIGDAFAALDMLDEGGGAE